MNEQQIGTCDLIVSSLLGRENILVPRYELLSALYAYLRLGAIFVLVGFFHFPSICTLSNNSERKEK